MKRGVRIAAFATAPISKREVDTLLVCIIGREGCIEGVLSSRVRINGTDSTGAIIDTLRRSRFRDQIRVIALNGISMAGLNIVDATRLEKTMGAKVVVLTRRRPSKARMLSAVRKFYGADRASRERAVSLLESIGRSVHIDGFYVYCESTGPDINNIVGTAYELLRIAHMVARGVSTGESAGRI
ncbi:MAG: DUF99 family protein [Candidatus Marsarchaeota archaeon]|nr:DUF99 family protein [Candidatus Marsarchaeota archaeon]